MAPVPSLVKMAFQIVMAMALAQMAMAARLPPPPVPRHKFKDQKSKCKMKEKNSKRILLKDLLDFQFKLKKVCLTLKKVQGSF